MKKITCFILLCSFYLCLMFFSYTTKAENIILSLDNIDEGKSYLLLFAEDTSKAIFDDGGRNEGWLRAEKYTDIDKFKFRIKKVGNGFNISNVATGYPIKLEDKAIGDKKYVVSAKQENEEKMLISLENTGEANASFYFKSQNNEYFTFGKDRNYLNYTKDKAEALKIIIKEAPKEKPYPYPENSQTLWDSPVGRNSYRIPAITTTNKGRIIAVSDLRYNHDSDLGNHKIDLLVKYSDDNGKTWSDSLNITSFNNSDGIGYGDAAIVADRDSDEVAIFAAFGTQGYWHGQAQYRSTRQNPIRVARFLSRDNGKSFSMPDDLTDSIYGLDNRFQNLFIAAGKAYQSRHIKIKDYYRLYVSILEGSTRGNYVLYSDDFGKNWAILGGNNTPIYQGDEAKIDELADGSLIISSRKAQGRFINVFSFDKSDTSYTKGTWANKAQLQLGRGSATNGEIYILPVKNNMDNSYSYLALQSLPTIGNARKGVGIYYKEIGKNTKTVQQYIQDWDENNFYLVQERDSAYSTMTLQADSRIGFLYEDQGKSRPGYDIQYLALNLEIITKGKYSLAYKGIGSKNLPYIVDSKEGYEAYKNIYDEEKVYFDIRYTDATPTPTTTPEPSVEPTNTPEISVEPTNVPQPSAMPLPTDSIEPSADPTISITPSRIQATSNASTSPYPNINRPAPKTGDDHNLLIYIAFVLLSLCSIISIITLNKKSNK